MNNTQRKMLDEIIKKRFREARNKLRTLVTEEFVESEKALLAKYEKKYAKLVRAGNEFYRLQKELDGELRAEGLNIDTYKSDEDKKVRLSFGRSYYSNANKEHLKLENEKTSKLDAIDQLHEDLRMEVWGSEKSFTEVKKFVEDALEDMEKRYGN